ncbi:MAG: hypothetical protein GY711_25940 [bacterium]|nr:hypothetical protein [bacterium]
MSISSSNWPLLALTLTLALGAGRLEPPGAVDLSAKELKRVRRLSPAKTLTADATNRFADDERAARLGQWLFFDPRLSANGEIACATCHDPALGFADGKPLAETLGKGTRHTPTLLNVAFQRWFFWDGRADSLWSQALGPIENPIEMGSDRTAVGDLIAGDDALRDAYERVFGPLPDLAGVPPHARPAADADDELGRAWSALTDEQRQGIDRVFANVGKAIAAYERRLIRTDAPFDRFVASLGSEDGAAGAALSPAAQRGLKLFVGRGNCTMCHNGPLFSDLEFHNTSAPPLGGGALEDPGRYRGIALLKKDPFNSNGAHSDAPEGEKAKLVRRLKRSSDSWGEFKTPSLRNVAEHAPFMHQGQFADLAAVIQFYSTLEGAAGRNHHAEQVLVPLDLSQAEASDLERFLESLTGTPLDPALTAKPASPGLPD